VETIDRSKRFLLGHTTIPFDIGLYFNQEIDPDAGGFEIWDNAFAQASAERKVVGVRSFDSAQREAVLKAFTTARMTVVTAIPNILKWKNGHPFGQKSVVDVLRAKALERPSANQLKLDVKQIFDQTEVVVNPKILTRIFWVDAANSLPLKDLIRFHVIWTALGMLLKRMSAAPYVLTEAAPPAAAQHLNPVAGVARNWGKGAAMTAPYTPAHWDGVAKVFHIHRETYVHEANAPDTPEKKFGAALVHFNAQVVIQKDLYWVNQTVWTLIHEYSHLLSSTTDEVGNCDGLYWRVCDKDNKEYRVLRGAVVNRVQQGERMKCCEGSLNVFVSAKYQAYKAAKLTTNMPADAITCLFMACSTWYEGFYNGGARIPD
jgi:hypothetical protein